MPGSETGEATIGFFAEWLSSTVHMIFEPTRFGAAVKDQKNRNLAFSASSVGVAFTIFQLVSSDVKLSAGSALALILIGIWCIYSILAAALIKLLGAREDYLANVLIGVRLLSVFYVIEMIVATVVFLIMRDRVAFDITFIFVGTILYFVFVPFVLCRSNGFRGARVVAFVVLCLPLGILRALVAWQVSSNGGMEIPPPMMIMAPL